MNVAFLDFSFAGNTSTGVLGTQNTEDTFTPEASRLCMTSMLGSPLA